MRLTNLEPCIHGTVADGIMDFLCPFPKSDDHPRHRIRIAISAAPYHERDPRDANDAMQKNGKVRVWQASGEFPESLTLQPSVNVVDDKGVTLCWHGHITAGAVT